jgi:drug/metabolite transporter (DMT)-like permease
MALEHAQGTRSARPKEELIPGRTRLTMNHVLFLATFLGAWFVLDRLVTSRPYLLSATAALAAASAVPDSWLFERPYPDRFSVVILTASIVVPMSVFLFRDRFFRTPSPVTVRQRLRAAA